MKSFMARNYRYYVYVQPGVIEYFNDRAEAEEYAAANDVEVKDMDAASVLAIPSGRLSDRFGRSRILVPGYLIYGLVYFGFALLSAKPAVLLLFIAYGAYTAFISGAERAFIAENAPAGFKGTVLGIYGMLQGVGLLLSSIIAGFLWDRINSNAPFLFGGALGIASAVMIGTILMGNSDAKGSKGYQGDEK